MRYFFSREDHHVILSSVNIQVSILIKLSSPSKGKGKSQRKVLFQATHTP